MDRATPPAPAALMPPLPSFLAHMQIHVAEADRDAMAQRFARHAPEMYEILLRLYGQRENFRHWMQRLCETIGQMHAARPGCLRELDQSRLADPEWFTGPGMLGYCSYVDRFGCNLAGLHQRIPHLKDLGVTYLHLLPFLRMREGENDGGFAIANFEEIEPRLGNMADLRKLTAALRAAGISLCSDFILNHVAESHPWAQAARAGDAAAREFFHTFPDRKQPDDYEQTLGQVFPAAAPGNFTYDDKMRRWVWTTFYPYQWDLNYANPEVFSSMAATMLHLANQGVEVFRLDSTGFLWKRLGTSCMNQPEAHWILQAMRHIVDIAAPGVLLKAEAIVPTAALPAYFGNGTQKECQLAYHATLMASGWAALAEQRAELVEKVAAATPDLPAGASWLTYIRSHDDVGWNVLLPEAGCRGRIAAVARFYAGEAGSHARGADFQSAETSGLYATNGMASALAGFAAATTEDERRAALARLMLLYGLAFTFGGMPLLYMGDEQGQGNDEAYRDDPAHAGDGRWLHRPVFDEQAYAARLQTGGEDTSSPVHALVFQSLRHLIGLRRSLPQLAARQARSLLATGNPALLAYTRGCKGKELLFVANFSPLAQELDLSGTGVPPGEGWRDALSGRRVSAMLRLEGLAQAWLVRA